MLRATSGVTWALTSSGNSDLLRVQWRQVTPKVIAGHTVKNHWFVSVETQRFSRRTETFPTETEAKQFEMLSNKYRIVAGTLLRADQPARRIISGSQLDRWIEEEES
jgi:hypothetical protein